MHYQEPKLRHPAHQRELIVSERKFDNLSITQTNLSLTGTGAEIMTAMEHIKNSTNLTTDVKLNATQTKTLAECVTNRKHLPVFFMSNIQSFSNSSERAKL